MLVSKHHRVHAAMEAGRDYRLTEIIRLALGEAGAASFSRKPDLKRMIEGGLVEQVKTEGGNVYRKVPTAPQ